MCPHVKVYVGAAVYVHVCVSHKEERRAAQVHVCVYVSHKEERRVAPIPFVCACDGMA